MRISEHRWIAKRAGSSISTTCYIFVDTHVMHEHNWVLIRSSRSFRHPELCLHSPLFGQPSIVWFNLGTDAESWLNHSGRGTSTLASMTPDTDADIIVTGTRACARTTHTHKHTADNYYHVYTNCNFAISCPPMNAICDGPVMGIRPSRRRQSSCCGERPQLQHSILWIIFAYSNSISILEGWAEVWADAWCGMEPN